MSLKPCKECRHTISDDSLWCVNCGSIPISRMIYFLVSIALASIPALIILAVIGFGLSMIFGGAFIGKP